MRDLESSPDPSSRTSPAGRPRCAPRRTTASGPALGQPHPDAAPYAATEAALANTAGALAQLLAPRGIRANSVASGPVWTPLIPATMPEEQVKSFGEQSPMGRPGQPAELAPVSVLLASDEASSVSGSRIAVTGGTPIL